MKKRLYNFIFFNVLCWKLIGTLEKNIKKCVVIVIPHTSNLDFFIALLVRGIMGIEINFVGRKFTLMFLIRRRNIKSLLQLIQKIRLEVVKKNNQVELICPVNHYQTNF
jgi:hypothetical protein